MASPEKENLCGSFSSSSTSEAKESSCKVVDPLVLLDEYWFFRSSLTSNPPRASPLISSSNTYWDDEVSSTALLMAADPPMKTTPPSRNTSTRTLVRTPSTPPPHRAGGQDSGDPNPTSEEAYIIAMGRRRSSPGDRKAASPSMLKAPSLPAPTEFSISKLKNSCSFLHYHGHQYSSSRIKRHNSSVPRIRQSPRDNTMSEGSSRWLCGRPRSDMINEANYRKLFQEKKWKSFSNLGSMEVQGIKDLGFVFDQEESSEGLSMTAVIPGLLREKRPSTSYCDDDRETPGPCLSEAWFVQQRSAPSLVLKRGSESSAADMKEQLRFWARVVACNIQQEC